MKDLIEESADPFEQWIGERPAWLQTAASDLLNNRRMPNDEEIDELATLCHQEATGTGSPAFRVMPKGLYDQMSSRPPLRLKSLFDVQSVAAIHQGAVLDFSNTDLSIVYGPNGSGKTGFARILKQICGAKVKDDIHPNVFHPTEDESSAKISFSIGADDHQYGWSVSTGSCTALRQVQVFDSKTASIYAFSKSTPSFEPSRIRFISSLIKVSDAVSANLEARAGAQISKLPTIPNEFAVTETAKWLSKLTPTVRHAAIDSACDYSEAHKEERLSLEIALAQKDITIRLNAITTERTTLTQLQQLSSGLKNAFSDDTCKSVVAARSKAKEKRTAATVDADRVFAGASVEGVGSPSWRLFWEKAKEYSLAAAYPKNEFPHVEPGAACLLCHRELDLESRERLVNFESFIRSGLEAEAKSAETELQNLISVVPDLPASDQWTLQLAGLKQPDLALSLHMELSSRREFLMNAVNFENVPVVSWDDFDGVVSAQIAALDAEQNSLKAAQDEAKRKQMVSRLLELRAREWATQNKRAIVDELARLGVVSGINKAVGLTKTTALTKKSNELAETEIETGYQNRFAKELERLGGRRLNVVPLCKKEGKGKVSFGIALKDAKIQVQAESVLSEGEARIVALAAFLADITGHNQSTTFIFDDPISSLDQDFEERVLARLVELALERQVIIFTHRLSLLALVEEAVEKEKKKAETLKRDAPLSLSIRTLRRVDRYTGVVVPHRLRDNKPKKAVTIFKNELIPEAKKLLTALDPTYERYLSSLCSDLRILVESTIETNLLNEVVLRFRRSVTTQGRIAKLAKISEPDCSFFDDLMTRYSVFEHSQSDELAAPVPDLGQIEEDLDRLDAWIKQFDQRAA